MTNDWITGEGNRSQDARWRNFAAVAISHQFSGFRSPKSARRADDGPLYPQLPQEGRRFARRIAHHADVSGGEAMAAVAAQAPSKR